MRLLRLFYCILASLLMLSYAHAEESPTQPDAGEAVPASLISLGEDTGHGILVEKLTQRLTIYNRDYNVVKTAIVTTGKNSGNKMQHGDRKTPEGVYFFTDIIDKEKLLPEYGIMALSTNYPNPVDVARRRNGGGIWLHATDQPTRPLKPYDTKGCVVTANEDILDIAQHIDLETTPIITVDKIRYTTPDRLMAERSKITDFLMGWRDAWEKKDLERYISNYSEHFYSIGMDRKEWRSHKGQLNRYYSDIAVGVRDIKILQADDYVVATFTQDYRSNIHTDLGIKRLYLVKEGDVWKIISEEWKEMPVKDVKAIAYNLNGNNGRDRDAPAKDRVESRKIDIEDFSIDKDRALRVRFRLVNKVGNGEKLRGRLAIVMEGINGKGRVYSSYPSIHVSDGEPLNFKDGEWFSISRFKVVEGVIRDPHLEDIKIGPVKIWVYSQDGRLMLVREFSAEEIAL